MKTIRIIILMLLLFTLTFISCEKKPPPPASVLEAAKAAALPLNPLDPAWEKVPEQLVTLLPQNLAPPQIETPAVTQLWVKVLSQGDKAAFRLRWTDDTRNDQSTVSRFTDAVAVQLPADPAGELPEPTMGQPERPVEIIFWRASWQAEVDGRPRALRSFFPNAWTDTTPPQAVPPGPEREAAEQRYQVARSAGNPLAIAAQERPVQDLTARGFGTLAPSTRQISQGRGVWRDGRWTVVMVRPLTVHSGGTYAAFAVWDGAKQNVGARKMRSNWLPLRMKE